MFYEKEWPVLEFDDSPTAKLNPSHYAGDGFDTDKMDAGISLITVKKAEHTW